LIGNTGAASGANRYVVECEIGIAQNLDNLGVTLTVNGQYQRAITHHRQAHAINQDLGDLASTAMNQHHLALAYAGLADVSRSTLAFRAAVSIYRDLGSRRWEAAVLADFGTMLNAAGETALARATLRSALDTMRAFADPRAHTIQAALTTMDTP